MRTSKFLNQEAFELALREYATSMKLIKLGSHELRLSKMAEEAIENTLIVYLVESNLFLPSQQNKFDSTEFYKRFAHGEA